MTTSYYMQTGVDTALVADMYNEETNLIQLQTSEIEELEKWLSCLDPNHYQKTSNKWEPTVSVILGSESISAEYHNGSYGQKKTNGSSSHTLSKKNSLHGKHGILVRTDLSGTHSEMSSSSTTSEESSKTHVF